MKYEFAKGVHGLSFAADAFFLTVIAGLYFI